MERMNPNDNNKQRRVGLRPFSEVIGDLADGDVERELTARIAEVVRAVQANPSKKGKLTLTITVSQSAKLMQINTDVKTTIPKAPLEATGFYVDDKGSLTKDNPRQTNMPFSGPKSVATDDSKEG